MADQLFKTWAEKKKNDNLTSSDQRRDIKDEEFQDGWLRLKSVSAQQLNQLFYLASVNCNASYGAPELRYSAAGVPDTALEMNGQAITQLGYPNLFSIYGAALPDLTSEAPSGFTYIVRKS